MPVPRRSVAEWLLWQESLYPRAIDLQLDRVLAVSSRLALGRPTGPVFTVTGTNGKGSTVAALDGFLRRAGRRTGTYTSPHLVAYNERVRIDGRNASDGELLEAFERVEEARAGAPLTFFEFGTLAALDIFRARSADAWVLEVGMGGRLDAVNIIDADFAIITTVDLDHQAYLGQSVEEIAAEKAGIMRSGRPAFYGDWPAPAAIHRVAAEKGAVLCCLGAQFDFTPARPNWAWRGAALMLEGLVYPPAATAAQLRNLSVALAALEQYDPALIADVATVNEVVGTIQPPGRFQVVAREHQWILDVAHNRQAMGTLRAQLDTLPASADMTVVVGMLGDKSLAAAIAALGSLAQRWVACTVDDPRARSAASIVAELRGSGIERTLTASSPEEACVLARDATSPGGRILVCGSFRVVGPALRWLGIY